MKHILSIFALLAALTASANAEVKSAEEIARKLDPGTRGIAVEKRSYRFSPETYAQLNPGVDARSRQILIVPTGNHQQATVSVVSTSSVSFENIRFKIDSIELADEESDRQLIAIAEALQKIGNYASFVIEGHTCSLGDDPYNHKLSEKRALAVGVLFRKQGVKCELAVFGKGEEEPLNSNATESERQANRRVIVRRKA